MSGESQSEGLPGGVGLAEAIEALRTELTLAMENAAGQGMRFKPGPVELTVEAALTTGLGGKADIRWWLIEAGGEASLQSVATQTLKITLQPVLLDSQGRVVDALVSGAERSRGPGSGESRRPRGAVER